MLLANSIKALVRDVKDFPKPGIMFKDITPVLADPVVRREIVVVIANNFKDKQIKAVAGIEARGFILGSLIAQELELPFIPIRKSGKLPYRSVKEEYALEYGTAAIEMHEDAVKSGDRILIHDDLLATGGTANAAGQLVRKSGGVVAGFSFLINLTFLPGEEKILQNFNVKPFSVVEY